MIYGFARQSNGQVRIYSELGQGTTMCIYLPRYVGHADDAENEQAVEIARAGRGETVLIVDDEPTSACFVTGRARRLWLRRHRGGGRGLALKVLQSGARVDLLVTDVGLPGGLNGRQVADAGRSIRPGLKVLFITGYAENAAVGNGHLDHGNEGADQAVRYGRARVPHPRHDRGSLNFERPLTSAALSTITAAMGAKQS